MYEKTILIAEDEPKTREGIKRVLEKWANGRHLILTATNGREALDITEKQIVHVVITDIRMPEISGLDLIKKLKETPFPPIIIIISAYSEFDYAQEALGLGVLNYLLKPISKKELIRNVEEALRSAEKQERSEILEKVVDNTLVQAYSTNPTNESIREAMHYIDHHLKNDLTQKEVADYVHLNPSYLSVLFKEQVNLTFSEYVTRRRIQHAKNLLLTTKLPIVEIAEESGYRSAKYFNKIFKEYEGVTPGAYRKTLK